ncbi:ArsR family transcription regulator [Natronomonas pharaonis DSM 2160]|uniref:ArsR family transcription regulator n=1 Tax=Natronomonas pharaonis (strain ATCC 35678 / DSM 2160 / CIP 103997 / JCM 8858 / NBRC 14720 / NCIMB 2260 / Gabara) TaxID=348780 RepID=A0A1U7EVF3_NATPD|nr:helix-turn-helix domain-containing protein [Natronomonas pharaonis]CAI49010.1 ArsR family transcription regulator [Natronomonas pharaonis DSM 2160]
MGVDELASPRLDRPDEPAVESVTLEDGAVIEALSSSTARQIVRSLQPAPAAASAIAEETETSIQTVSYHLDQLQKAGLVAPVGTTYSEKGTEMELYATTTESFRVVIG